MAITAPTDITGCVLWLDPASITANDGDLITAWNDETVNNNDASAAGDDRPTYRDGTDYYHGRPNIEFNGTTNRLTVAAAASLDNANATYAIVCRLNNLAANTDPSWLINKVNTNAATVGMRICDSDGANPGLYENFFRLDGSEGTVRTIASRGPYRQAWTVFIFRYDGTTGEMYIDNDLSGSLSQSGSIDADNSGLLAIGNHSSADLAWRGRIADVVVYDNAISNSDLTDLVDYLKGKYPDSEYVKQSSLLSSGIRHARVRTAAETGESDNQMIVCTTAGAINHYTSPTNDPHNWTLQNSNIVTLDANYRTLDFVVVSGTWYLYIDRATGNGAIELFTGAAVTSLTEHGSSPVIAGSVGDYQRTPGVIEESGSWTMLVDVRTDSILGAVGYVDRYTSADGISWTKDAANSPVINSAGTGFADTDITHPHIYKRDDSSYLVTFAGYNDNHPLTASFFPHEIGFALSEDLINFTFSNKNPALTMDHASGDFDITLVSNPCLWDDGSNLVLYYSGRTIAGDIQIGWAQGPDSIDTGAPRLERWSNDGTTTINDAGGISAGDTSVTVTSVTSFPSNPDFRLKIENEIVLVTAISGNTLTIVRAQDGTSAAAHADSTAVNLYLTAGSVDQAWQDGFAEPDYPLNRILDQGVTRIHSDFTWVNQGTATSATADDGGILMTCPSEASNNVRLKVRSAPGTPYTITTFCMLGPGFADFGTDGSWMGPCLRENSTGKLYVLAIRGDRIALWRFTNETTFSAQVDTHILNNRHAVWLQLQDDGTNIRAFVSVDGYVWEECFNEGRTSHMAGGPDEVGFAINSGGGDAGAHFYFKSWILE